jgi:hypothetical protein
MEDDGAIFKALLEPLVLDNISEVLKKQQLNPNSLLYDSDEEEDEAFTLLVVRKRFYT